MDYETILVTREGRVATITLNRPERKNPLTFDSYAELRDLFRTLAWPPVTRVMTWRSPGSTVVKVAVRVKPIRSYAARAAWFQSLT